MNNLKEFKYVLFAAAGLFLISLFGGLNVYKGEKKSGHELSSGKTHGETISFVGTVISRKGTSSNTGLVLTLRGDDGYEVTCIVPEDVAMPFYEMNDRFEIQASSNGGFLTVLDIKRQKNPMHKQYLSNVTVQDEYARFQRGQFVAKIPAPGIPDGTYDNLVETYSDEGYSVISKPEED